MFMMRLCKKRFADDDGPALAEIRDLARTAGIDPAWVQALVCRVAFLARAAPDARADALLRTAMHIFPGETQAASLLALHEQLGAGE